MNRAMATPWVWLGCFAVLGAGCAGMAGVGLLSDDNNPDRLAEALAVYQAPAAGQPMNATGKPLAFLVTRSTKRDQTPQALIAYDLADKQELWRVEAEVTSRVLVSREFVAHRDGTGKLVARAMTSGAVLWSIEMGEAGEFLGASVDAERLYYVKKDSSGAKPLWWLIAIDGTTGTELWRKSAPGTLGAPAAQGGLVFSPFLKQWLRVMDAKTGAQVARIRGDDEEISFVRTTPEHVYFGSSSGVFLLDEKAASGKRALSTYGRAKVPEQFVRARYFWNSFDLIQHGYSAYDRNRLLWRGKLPDGQTSAGQGSDEASGQGSEQAAGQAAGETWTMGFADDLVIVYTYRFFFGFDSNTGVMRWAYNHPRYDVVGAAHLGKDIIFVSGLGEFVAMEAGTGQQVYKAKLDAQLVGVTFDAEGFAPEEESNPMTTVTALASIAKDRDKRFNEVQRFAVSALAELPGADVTRDLIALIQNERTSKQLYDRAVDVLITRRDARGLGHIINSLQVPHDYITGSAPENVGVLARAVAALGDHEQVDPAMRGATIDALLLHLFAPETSSEDLIEVIKAMGAMGRGTEIAPLRLFVMAYRADPVFASDAAPMGAAIDVLLTAGGPAERELIGYLADEPRTQKSVAEYARRALEQALPVRAEATPSQ
jgi:outer membrane protein assembly factor BamB